MFGFKAFFLNDRVYINDVCYRNNEILASLLNMPRRNLQKLLDELKLHRRHVRLVEDDYDHCVRFNWYAHEAQDCLFKVGNIVKAVLPYKHFSETNKMDTPLLFQCLNEHYLYWVNSIRGEDAYKSSDYINDYGFSVKSASGRYIFIHDHFYPNPDDLVEPEAYIKTAMDELNQALAELFDDYIRVVQDLMRVKNAYAELLEQINAQSRYLSDEETAEVYKRFLQETKNKYPFNQVVSGGTMKLAYEVYRKMDRTEHLCEAYEFESLGAFLYFDFFRGLGRQYIPRRCDNCGKYFLQRSGKYSNYCEEPLKENKRKTCRDIGARKKYDDKCKTDPIWLAYNRAYKTHYARYMKKKMTTAEFEQWSRYAVDLREDAIAGKLEQAEYEKVLKI